MNAALQPRRATRSASATAKLADWSGRSAPRDAAALEGAHRPAVQDRRLETARVDLVPERRPDGGPFFARDVVLPDGRWLVDVAVDVDDDHLSTAAARASGAAGRASRARS